MSSDHEVMVLSADYVTRFYQELYAQADTIVLEDDAVDVKLAKLTKQLSIVSRLNDFTNASVYKDVEEYLLNKVRRCEHEVFEAIIEKDEKREVQLAIERAGIVQLFDCFEAAALKRDAIAQEIQDLREPIPDDPGGAEPN